MSSYNFSRNDPFDWTRAIELVVARSIPSAEYMNSIRTHVVDPDSLTLWYLGQNGFILKDSDGPLIGIDLYLTNSCAADNTGSFRNDRQLPIFIEPEDLDIDVFITTHSHQDHADPETIRRLRKLENMVFIGPFDSCKVYEQCGVPKQVCRLFHPGESLQLGATKVTATFALPTDDTDLNHSGVLLHFASGITFFNSGDTAWAQRLPALLPTGVDICSICINGGYHNLAPEDAAAVVKAVSPSVVIPCHYDMMINNIGSPEMFKVALQRAGVPASFQMLRYYEPWSYRRSSAHQKD